MQNLPDYLTEDQKRFWSQKNWGNLKINGQDAGILGVFFDKEIDDNYPVSVVMYNPNGKIHTRCYSIRGVRIGGHEILEEVRPKKTMPWGKEDFIKHRNCLFTVYEGSTEELMWVCGFYSINDVGVKFTHNTTVCTFKHMAKYFQHSPDDGITWLPCTKEVAR